VQRDLRGTYGGPDAFAHANPPAAIPIAYQGIVNVFECILVFFFEPVQVAEPEETRKETYRGPTGDLRES
jgi:hypothetical protein